MCPIGGNSGNGDLEARRSEFIQLLWQAIMEAERRTGRSPNRAELARRLGVSPASLYAYLKGTTLPRTDVFDRMMFELGIDGRTMGRLHELRDQVDLARRTDPIAMPVPAAGSRYVCDLPRDTAILEGRAGELEAVEKVLRDRSPGAPTVCVVCGPGGVGKTALAVRAAYRLTPEYPEGLLFFDLHGFSAEPVTAATALTRLLRRLGVPAASIPPHPDDRSGLLREVLRDRRLLLVLDNALETAQVLSLLPGTGSCRVLVTSRIALNGLEDAARVRVGPLPHAESVRLLRGLVANHAELEPVTALDDLAHRCGGLPLALRIVAARIRDDPATLGELLAPAHRVDLAAFDDQDRDLRSVFSASVRHLHPDSARAFTLLGLHRGPDVDDEALAALTEADHPAARRTMRVLVDAHLLETGTGGRYRLHDLVREFAREQLGTAIDADDRDAATVRLVDHYLGLADAADRILTPHRHRTGMCPDHPVRRPPASYDDAMNRMTEELDNMVAALRCAYDAELDSRCWQLAFALREFCFIVNGLDVWIETHRLALAAAQRAGSPYAEAVTSNNLGLALLISGDDEAAEQMYSAALDLFRGIGDKHGEHITLAHRAWVHVRRGNLEQALHDSTTALAFMSSADAPRHRAILLRDTARIEIALDRCADAVPKLDESLSVFDVLGLAVDAATARLYLGEAHLRMGEIAGARTAYAAAVDAAQEAGSVFEESRANEGLAETAAADGDHALARRHWKLAMNGYTELHLDEARERMRRKLNGDA